MPVSAQTKVQHLCWRSGFGASPGSLPQAVQTPLGTWYNTIEQQARTEPGYLDVARNIRKELLMQAGDTEMNRLPGRLAQLTAEQRRLFNKQSREDLKNLSLAWLNQMVNTPAQLREKMALFWHGHFACRNNNVYFQQKLLGAIRTNALGNFGDLLRAVSKSAAMLAFLNNQQNRKQHPNENFAREVMELFTLGRGNYTEQDIREAARAFTGWGYNLDGEFVFRPRLHDDGKKTVFGKSGRFDGDDVLNLLLEKKETALFITRKVYRYFVNEEEDASHVHWLADRFYQSHYAIDALMRDIFTSDWFYDEKNIGTRIKSPVELLVGIRRTLPMQLDNEAVQLLLQRVLGQLLFYPPNVAGWPGGKNWIDSSTLMVRLRIPQLIKDDDSIYITPKTDDDQQMGMKENFDRFRVTQNRRTKQEGFQISARVDWAAYARQLDELARPQLFTGLAHALLSTPAGSVTETTLAGMISRASREEYIKTVTIALMSTPEYQLC
jgi:uncharacterized protein (DUF1800 family)